METRNKVFVKRNFACSVSDLFNWLVQPELIAKWFGPKHYQVGVVYTDLQVGGRYSIELKKSDRQNFTVEGEYLEVNAPHNLSFTFQYKGLPSRSPKSVVKIQIAEVTPQESSLSLVQDFEWVPSNMEARTEAWEYMLQLLDDNISSLESNTLL